MENKRITIDLSSENEIINIAISDKENFIDWYFNEEIKEEQDYTLNNSFKSFIEDMINYYDNNKECLEEEKRK